MNQKIVVPISTYCSRKHPTVADAPPFMWRYMFGSENIRAIDVAIEGETFVYNVTCE